jgi:hypothetical protein
MFRIRIVCFWASWIRIRNLFVRINTQINEDKTWFLLFCDFFKTFYLWRMILIYFQKEISIKTLRKTKLFLMASWRSLTKRAGSGSGTDSQRYWSEDPDPYQNVTDPVHCSRIEKQKSWSKVESETIRSRRRRAEIMQHSLPSFNLYEEKKPPIEASII